MFNKNKFQNRLNNQNFEQQKQFSNLENERLILEIKEVNVEETE